jgi:dephospho-CoA kinase
MPNPTIIVGLVGLTGAGKSTGGDIIINEFGFRLIRLGNFLKQELKNSGLDETPENERKAQVAIRDRHGMNVFAKFALPQIEAEIRSGNRVLLDSMCSFSEKTYLSSMLATHRICVIAFHAPLSKRENQVANRVRRPLTKHQMNQRDLLEIDQ